MEAGAAVALVTGAARGIGAEIARRLSHDGHSIAAVDVRDCAETVESVHAAGGAANAYRCDVRSWTDTARTIDEIEKRQGAIEVSAAVAGVWEHVPFLELDSETWHRVLDVNLEGAFNVCQLSARRMVLRQRGAIVCVSSNAAFLAWSGGAHYSASKAGLLGLVKGMALELGQYGVRANAVCPGTVNTPATAVELSDPATGAAQARAVPLGRVGEPADIAEAVAFLADPRRAGWITGEALLIDGGFGTHGQDADFGVVSRSAT